MLPDALGVQSASLANRHESVQVSVFITVYQFDVQ